LKHVEAINRNKLKANSASCWSCYSDKQEVLQANDTLRKNTEPGAHTIPGESLTVHEEEPKDKLQKPINSIWEKQKVLHAWRTSVICQIHEEADILNRAKYRGIIFLKTAYEICTNKLHEKSKTYAKKLTSEYLSGFVERDQLLVTYSICGKPWQNAGSITYHYCAGSPTPKRQTKNHHN
jgi:hypothetical protein